MGKSVETFTKEEIARLLNPDEPLSVRSVERYIQLAGVKPVVKGKGRGSKSRYSREDVDRIVAIYRKVQEGRETAPHGAQLKSDMTYATFVTDGFECCDAALIQRVSEYLSQNLDKPVWVAARVLKSLKRCDSF
jgi:hypothetical protein